MATMVTVDGQEYKRRSPFGVWVLSIITGGIYMLVWYVKINGEARRYLRDETINPVASFAAFVPGALLLYIPPLISVYRSGKRVRVMQEADGGSGSVSPLLTLILLFVFSLWVVYLQSALNSVWDRASSDAPAVPSPGTA